MKYELNIGKNVKETLVKILAKNIDEEVQSLIEYIEHSSNYIVGFADDKLIVLNVDEIIRIYIEDRKTYAITPSKKYLLRMKLYEVDRLLSKDFVKISQSEIANIKFIKNLDLSIRGTIVIKYKNRETSYVSRRMIKNFKEKLGL